MLTLPACIGAAMGKRDEGSGNATIRIPEDLQPGKEGKCTQTAQMDKLVLKDGHMFDIGKDMPDETRNQLMDHTFGGSTIDMLHQDLLAHEVDHEGVQKRAEDNGFYKA